MQYYVQKCDGRNSLIWIIIAYGYVLLTQLASIFLAFRTRKVKVKVLNDSKYIALIIYITSVIVTVMIIGAVTLDNYINADAAVFSGLILTFTTVVLTLVFVPKVCVRQWTHSQAPTLWNVNIKACRCREPGFFSYEKRQ